MCSSDLAVFFGESMYAKKSEASKVALVYLVRQLERWDFRFLDCQIYTENLDRFGATEWPREKFLVALESALEGKTRRGKWQFDPDFDPVMNVDD